MDSQETSFKLICDPLAITSKKIEIAARYAGMQLTIVEFDPNTANEATLKEFLKKSPDGLTPVLETPEGCLFEANAILRFVGRYNDNSKLYGDSFFEKAMVDQFLDWSTLTLEPIYAQYVLPYLGYTIYDKKAHEQSFKAYKEVLAVLEEQLKKSKYVVGNNITLPDIQIVSLLHFNYRYNFDEKTRKTFPNLTKYFESVAGEDNFKRFLSKAFLCKTPLQPHKMKK